MPSGASRSKTQPQTKSSFSSLSTINVSEDSMVTCMSLDQEPRA